MNDPTALLEGGAQDVNLAEVTSLCEVLISKQLQFERMENDLKLLREEIQHLEQNVIPEKMHPITEIKLDSGARVVVQPFIRANIKVEDRPKAFLWLDEIGEGEIVKTTISIKYGRGEIAQAKGAVASLREIGYPAELNEEVHWQTLNAWAKDQDSKGREWPEFIGIFKGKQAKVK